MTKKKPKNLRAMRFMADADIGHEIEGAPEVRLRVYATTFRVRPNMRFAVGRIMNFNGTEKFVEEGHWTQTSAYLEDVDSLKLYTALVQFQTDLTTYRKEWERRREAREPQLSVFEMRQQIASAATTPAAEPAATT